MDSINTVIEAPRTAGHKQADEQTEHARIRNLSSILRIVSMVVLLTAAGTFLFQGWAGWDSVQRICAFLGFTTSLAATGLVCGLRFKDDKGARVSLSIATAIIPIAISQIGGLVYSLFAGKLSGIPDLLLFRAPSTGAVLAILLAATVILPPIAFAGFSALARIEARILTITYLIGNAILLIPSRNPTYVALVAFSLLIGVAYLDYIRFSKRLEMRTLEGAICRAMMLTPFLIMIGRNLALYSMSTLLLSCLFAVLAAFLFITIPQTIGSQKLAKKSQFLSTIPMALSWATFVHALFFAYGAILPLSRDFKIPMTMLPISIILFGMSFFTLGNGRSYRKFAAYIAISSMIFELLNVPGFVTAFFCILTSAVCMGAGCFVEEKGLFRAGCFGLCLGVLYQAAYAIQKYQGLGPWVGLAILGITILLVSSVIERYYKTIVNQTSLWRNRLRAWD